MSARFNWTTLHPAAYKAGIGLETAIQNSFLSPVQKELIKIRASQINGCAYCLDMHTKDALKYGETPQRIFILSAWRDAKELFTEEEQVILMIIEEITLIHQNGLTDETYEKALVFFDETQIFQVIMAVVAINMWNRIAKSTHMEIGK